MVVFIAFLSSTRPMWCLMVAFRHRSGSTRDKSLGLVSGLRHSRLMGYWIHETKVWDLSWVYDTLGFWDIGYTRQKFGLVSGLPHSRLSGHFDSVPDRHETKVWTHETKAWDLSRVYDTLRFLDSDIDWGFSVSSSEARNKIIKAI